MEVDCPEMRVGNGEGLWCSRKFVVFIGLGYVWYKGIIG
jgi:hypothetical protein